MMCENPEIPLKIYVGWTGENALAYEVCRASILAKASVPVEVHPLELWKCWALGYARAYSVDKTGQRYDSLDGRPFSSDFSFTRFLVPTITGFTEEWVLYCDSDMLFLDDVAELFAWVDGSKAAVACVKHPPELGQETVKKFGNVQTSYRRKNWSSLMLMRPSQCRGLFPTYINIEDGARLHGFDWLDNTRLDALPARWNVLHGIQSDPDPAVIHFTRGTPDMPHCSPDDEWSNLWWRCVHVLRSSRTGAVREMRRVIDGR